MNLAVQLQSTDDDATNLDSQAHQLREELLLLDLDRVMLERGTREPDNAKGDAIAIGTLVMSMSNSAVLVAACQVIRSWVTRGQGRRATIRHGKDQTLEITNLTAAQQQDLIDAFLRTVQHNPDSSDGRDDHGQGKRLRGMTVRLTSGRGSKVGLADRLGTRGTFEAAGASEAIGSGRHLPGRETFTRMRLATVLGALSPC